MTWGVAMVIVGLMLIAVANHWKVSPARRNRKSEPSQSRARITSEVSPAQTAAA
jgi:hypothetical protein